MSTERGFLRIVVIGNKQDPLSGVRLLVKEGLPCGEGRVFPGDVDLLTITRRDKSDPETTEMWRQVSDICEQHGIRFLPQGIPPEEMQSQWLVELSGVRKEIMNAVLAPTREKWLNHLRWMVPPWQLDSSGSMKEKALRGYYYYAEEILDSGSSTIRRLLEDLSREKWGSFAGTTWWGRQVRRGRRRPHQALILTGEKPRAEYDIPKDLLYVDVILITTEGRDG